MSTSKEEATASLIRFIQENNRYPTKHDCRYTDWLFSAQTYQRLLGPRNQLTLLEEYGEQPTPPEKRYCRHCGKELTGDKQNVFCNRSCAATYNNARKPPRPLKEKTATVRLDDKKTIAYKVIENKHCKQCGKGLEARTQKLFCSLQCHADHKLQMSIQNWLETGEASGNKALRKYITHLDGYQCSGCGISDWNGKPITLEVEHKDGNSEDDSRENVCLICPNCHSQTDTYKGKNRGNGRHWRTQRYHEGKSY